MKKNKHNEGYVIVISLVIATAVLLILGVFLGSTVTERKNVQRSYHSLRALNLAEAGVEKAIWELNNTRSGESWTSNDLTVSSGGASIGKIDVTVTSTGNGAVIQATGFSPEANVATQMHRSVQVTADQEGKTAYDYTIATQSDLMMEDLETTVQGDIYAIGNITNENVTVQGDAYATGTIYASGSGSFQRSYGGVPPISFPTVDLADYESQASASSTLVNGDLTVSDDPGYSVPDVLYVKGNFKAEDSTLLGPGVVVAEGTIKLEDNSTCGASGAPVALLSGSSDPQEAIKLEVNSDIYGFIYAPDGGVKIETDGSVYGSVLGGKGVDVKVKIETGAVIAYRDYFSDGSLNLPEVSTKKRYVVATWREKK